MISKTRLHKLSLVLAAGWMLAASQLAGAADDRHDRDRQDNDRAEHGDNRTEQSRNESPQRHFVAQDRVRVRDYYRREFQGSRCPRGLQKMHNDCVAPGHVNHWQIGQRMPRDVVYYEVPPALVRQMGPPPRGSRYVRVDSDILLLALGTGVIIDAIEDLNH